MILTVTFVDQAGDHEVSLFPYVTIRDGTGKVRFPAIGGGCELSNGAFLTPGKTLGPLHLCYDALGAPADPITLTWAPSAKEEASLDLRL